MVTPVQLIPGTLLTAAAVQYYLSPQRTETVIKKITITNTDAVNAHAVSIWLVPAGGAAGNPQLLVDARAVGQLGTYDVTEAQNHVLAGGGSIWAKGDDAVNLQIQASGVQIV